MHDVIAPWSRGLNGRVKDKIAAESKLSKPGQTRRTHERSIAIDDNATGFRWVDDIIHTYVFINNIAD